MTENIPERQPASILHSALSFFVPGLGQIIAGQIVRGITFLISFVVLAWLSVWTIAQRARFPDLDISFSLYVNVFLQVLALLLFVIALRHVLARFVIKDISGQTFLGVGIGFLYIVALIFSQERILAMAGSEEDLKMIYGGTAIFAASALAAFHLWQVWDAGRVGAEPSWKPSMVAGILLSCVVIFSLGWNITEINMDKAIAEYEDWKILLPRIFWPWQAAFEYEQIAIESTAKIQAPCPEGSVGPEVNEPIEGEAWISVTPTCGDITTRDLAQGQLSFGTEGKLSLRQIARRDVATGWGDADPRLSLDGLVDLRPNGTFRARRLDFRCAFDGNLFVLKRSLPRPENAREQDFPVLVFCNGFIHVDLRDVPAKAENHHAGKQDTGNHRRLPGRFSTDPAGVPDLPEMESCQG